MDSSASHFAFAFDFDSTLVSVESLDELIALSLSETLGAKQAAAALEEIRAITDAGMNGTIDFRTSVATRLKKTRVSRKHLATLTRHLPKTITPGMAELIVNILKHGHPVFIISGALLECVHPVARQLNIPENRVFANQPIFDTHGNLTGIKSGMLASSEGKTHCLSELRRTGKITGEIVMVGDGISDLHPYRAGVAKHFLGIGIHRKRAAVEREAPHYFTDIDSLHRHIHSLLLP
jgi:D-3-phosphoglycerate dehydrogenase